MRSHDIILIIPAFEEESRLADVLAGVAESGAPVDVVVIDDGSQDATSRVAREAGAIVLRHPCNLGYGAAVQTGYKYALRSGAKQLVQMDADGQHDPRAIGQLLEALDTGDWDLIVGSRFLEAGDYHMSLPKRLGRDLFRGIARLLGMSVTDPTSGFQAMNRSVLEFYCGDFFPSDFPDVDVLFAVHRQGLRILEVPVEMSEGLRKSSLHSGLRTLYYPYKILLSLWAVPARRTGQTDLGEPR
ncbi:MAG: glycosyltransferase family 2 protein [Myxococcota bacterium]